MSRRPVKEPARHIRTQGCANARSDRRRSQAIVTAANAAAVADVAVAVNAGLTAPNAAEVAAEGVSEAVRNRLEVAEAVQNGEAGDQPQNGQSFGENGEGARRKRRRRRGRRGGRDRVEGGSTPGFVNDAERFGAAPDEIDTTPSDTRASVGAPSAPVWSLKDDELDTTPKDDAPKKKGWWQKAFGGSDE